MDQNKRPSEQLHLQKQRSPGQNPKVRDKILNKIMKMLHQKNQRKANLSRDNLANSQIRERVQGANQRNKNNRTTM